MRIRLALLKAAFSRNPGRTLTIHVDEASVKRLIHEEIDKSIEAIADSLNLR